MVYSDFNYVENILKCAKDGLQKPEDFGYSFEDNYYPSDEVIYKAIYKLGLQNEEQYSKWVEFCEKNNLDMPASFDNEMSKNNPDQLKLFEVKDVNRY
jgi:hypothetical protein